MALSNNPASELINDNNLRDWKVIGSGGFGQIYKARHRQWGMDVAIKLLHHQDGSSDSMLREAELMSRGLISPHILRILGVYQGRPACYSPLIQVGLVMEFMTKGSLASLQETLRGPPPWPLAFRLAHEVGLGMTFLHNRSPPLLHLDLKPSNVLLDNHLSAKLTDFGLAKYYRTVTRLSKKDSGEGAGTISYMPPEAFNLSYRPSCASDVYSYSILLWSIVKGEQPYPDAFTCVVRFRIPLGDRPSLEVIDHKQTSGLEELVELMKRCWATDPSQRPSFRECIAVTETLYNKYQDGINDAVHQVIEQMKEENRITEAMTQVPVNQQPDSTRPSNHSLTRAYQEEVGGFTTNQRDKQIVKGQSSPQPIGKCLNDHVHSPTNKKRSSATFSPNQTRRQTPSPLHEKTYQKKTAKPLLVDQNQSGSLQRQFSNPEAHPHHPRTGARVSITMSNVTGLQIGNYNYMDIHTTDSSERRRHPTAPSRVNIPPPQPGSPWDLS